MPFRPVTPPGLFTPINVYSNVNSSSKQPKSKSAKKFNKNGMVRQSELYLNEEKNDLKIRWTMIGVFGIALLTLIFLLLNIQSQHFLTFPLPWKYLGIYSVCAIVYGVFMLFLCVLLFLARFIHIHIIERNIDFMLIILLYLSLIFMIIFIALIFLENDLQTKQPIISTNQYDVRSRHMNIDVPDDWLTIERTYDCCGWYGTYDYHIRIWEVRQINNGSYVKAFRKLLRKECLKEVDNLRTRTAFTQKGNTYEMNLNVINADGCRESIRRGIMFTSIKLIFLVLVIVICVILITMKRTKPVILQNKKRYQNRNNG
ncbi:hypothetical protein SNEBB_002480 [Seison nebaliae]|nr:hypothetical protein SNEBB_002480 [Seison nebaliae]